MDDAGFAVFGLIVLNFVVQRVLNWRKHQDW